MLAPGNSIGTLTVNGNVTFAAGSTYRVEVDAAGANDRINATGTATINGGTVDVQASAGTYQASTQYTLLNAAGGRTGSLYRRHLQPRLPDAYAGLRRQQRFPDTGAQ